MADAHAPPLTAREARRLTSDAEEADPRNSFLAAMLADAFSLVRAEARAARTSAAWTPPVLAQATLPREVLLELVGRLQVRMRALGYAVERPAPRVLKFRWDA